MWYHTRRMKRHARQISRCGEAEGYTPFRKSIFPRSRWLALSRRAITSKLPDYSGGALNGHSSALCDQVERAADPFYLHWDFNRWHAGTALAGRVATCCDRMGSRHLGGSQKRTAYPFDSPSPFVSTIGYFVALSFYMHATLFTRRECHRANNGRGSDGGNVVFPATIGGTRHGKG